MDMVKLAWDVASHPATGWLFGAVVVPAIGAWVRHNERGRLIAQSAADYVEAIERQAVLAAEVFGHVEGARKFEKLKFAADFVEARLAEAGFVGNADSVTPDRIRADLERIKQEVFPGSRAGSPTDEQK